MTGARERFAAAAERLEGVPFRLHGRDPANGLDCIGLAACALERAGLSPRAPSGYALRHSDIGRLLPAARDSGLVRATGEIRRGDVLLVRPCAAQHHLLVALGKGRVVHAHAGLGRVAVQEGLSGWKLLRHWRLELS